MRKHFLKILILFVFFVFPNIVDAARGDLVYEITKFNISSKQITVEGYAFIHRTQNYVTVYERTKDGLETSKEIKSNGGMRVKIKIADADNQYNFFEKEIILKNDPIGYNFYYQMYYDKPKGSLLSYYNNELNNSCNNTGKSNEGPCYYEDINFSVSFGIEDLFQKFSADTTLKIYIAAYNNDYGKYTDYVVAKTPHISGNSDYIDIVSGYRNGKVEFVAKYALWQKFDSEGKYRTAFYGIPNDTYYIFDTNEGNYNNGFKTVPNSLGGSFLQTTTSPGLYAFCVNTSNGRDACKKKNDDNYCTKCGGKVLSAYASWVSLVGLNELNLKIKNDKKCDVKDPRPDELKCNNSGTLSSICEELTIHTDKGSAVVKMVQTGTISSVMTPGSIYAGGGFKFGIMYQNNIKWSYKSSIPGTELHNAVSSVMNDKLKDYDSYIAGINISNLNLVDENKKTYSIDSGMVKQCFTSSTGKNYYGDNGLTVTCIFTFPSSSIGYDGKINYKSIADATSFGINNKYYTFLDKIGKFDVTATISGMDRITESAAKDDSAEQGKAWTGAWIDNIDGCEINVYPLLYTGDGKYNFIYRPIDIKNPFPNRNAGINWYDWISVLNNQVRLENTYSNVPEYISNINNNTMTGIKDYNKKHNYLDWNSIDSNGNSSFIDGYDYVKREGGS